MTLSLAIQHLGKICSHYFLSLKCLSSSPFSLYQNLTNLPRLGSKISFKVFQLTPTQSFSCLSLKAFHLTLNIVCLMLLMTYVYIKTAYAAYTSKLSVPSKCFLIILLMLSIVYHEFSQMYKNEMYFIQKN